jgi:hypothetical protein
MLGDNAGALSPGWGPRGRFTLVFDYRAVLSAFSAYAFSPSLQFGGSGDSLDIDGFARGMPGV